jgi:hypothetical protein
MTGSALTTIANSRKISDADDEDEEGVVHRPASSGVCGSWQTAQASRGAVRRRANGGLTGRARIALFRAFLGP